MSACVVVASSRVWSPGFAEMIVIARVLALKCLFNGGNAFHRRERPALEKPDDAAAAVAGAPSVGTVCHLLAGG